MKLQIIRYALLFLPVSGVAQVKNCECKFQAIGAVGLAMGESRIKPLIQFSAGKTYKGFFLGGGTGMDFYKFKSIPLFADLRYSVGSKRSAFVYNKDGYNFPIDNKSQETLRR